MLTGPRATSEHATCNNGGGLNHGGRPGRDSGGPIIIRAIHHDHINLYAQVAVVLKFLKLSLKVHSLVKKELRKLQNFHTTITALYGRCCCFLPHPYICVISGIKFNNKVKIYSEENILKMPCQGFNTHLNQDPELCR